MRGAAELERAALADPENPALFEALVRAHIREGLRLKTKEINAGFRALTSVKDNRGPPAEARIRRGASALAALAYDLLQGEEPRRQSALKLAGQLGLHGRPITEAIAARFGELAARDERPQLREACRILKHLADARAVPGLMAGYGKLLINDDLSRCVVMEALGSCGDHRPELMAFLEAVRDDPQEDEEVRAEAGAARVAAASRSADALDAIIDALEKGPSDARSAAARGLRDKPDLRPDAVAAVKAAIAKDDDLHVLEDLSHILALTEAESALAFLSSENEARRSLAILAGCIRSEIPIPRLVDEILRLRQRGDEAPSAYDLRYRVNHRKGLRNALIRRARGELSDPKLEQALAAAIFLYEFSADPQIFLGFAPRVLRDGDEVQRLRALEILGRLRRLPPELKPPLRPLTEHPKVAVRAPAQALLFSMPGLAGEDLERLVGALSDRSDRIKIAAAQRLAQIPSLGKAAIPALRILAKSKKARVKEAAQRALRRMET